MFRKYVALYNEADYRNILLKNYNKTNASRGSKGSQLKKDLPKEEKNNAPQVFAFVVATDTYNKDQDNWGDLKNPINDAEAFSKVLEDKYSTTVKKVYNKTKNEILKDFLDFKC